jgi:hypothetical protein
MVRIENPDRYELFYLNYSALIWLLIFPVVITKFTIVNINLR